MLLRLAYLTVTNAFAVLRLLPMSDRACSAGVRLPALKDEVSSQEIR
ncbi:MULTISPECIES: hypothetical protein [unclassified Streptomyces]